MTIFYPDVSEFQDDMSLAGVQFVCARCSQGITFKDPDFGYYEAEATTVGAFFTAYHFLMAADAATSQAQTAFAQTGTAIPLMLDFEPTTGSNPTIADAVAFVKAFRALGGVCWFIYLPEWYWVDLGSPSLAPLAELGLMVVSSNYPASGYSDSGPGWAAYGGITPTCWQYTDDQVLNGIPVDYDAFKGTLGELESLWLTGTLTPAVKLALSPTSGDVPLSVTATAVAAAGSAPISEWSISFGDGSPAVAASKATHTFEHPGTYTVTVTVTALSGSTSKASVLITMGPYRQVAPGGKSLATLMAERGGNALNTLNRSIEFWTAADLATIRGLVLPGLPVYTAMSGRTVLGKGQSINSFATARNANAINMLARSIADWTATDKATILGLILPVGFPYYTVSK